MNRTEILLALNKLNCISVKTLSMKLSRKENLNLKKEIIKTTHYLKDGCKMTERLYNIINNITSPVLCKECKTNSVNFTYFNKGYLQFCGLNCSQNSKLTKNKYKETCIKRYGVDNVSKLESVKLKKEETCLDNYGVKNPQQNKTIQDKTKTTCNELYGGNAPACSKEIINKTINKRLINEYKNLLESNRLGNEYIILTTLEEYEGVKGNKINIQHKKCKTKFKCLIENGRIPRCPNCYNIRYSQFEQDVLKFCKQYYNKIQFNTKSIISPKELDIYIPEINLAIECNGIYWHTEANGKDKNYHLNKTKDCFYKGIDLIHIFEDEWIYKQNIIKSILLNKFGRNSKKIFGRKCQIGEVHNSYAKDFMNKNHLQGYTATAKNTRHFGLSYNDELVSVMTVGDFRFNNDKKLEVLRFCSLLNHQVLGGLSKLISHVKKVINPELITTYADMRFGVGKGYQSAGFKFIGITDPGYKYFKNGKLYSRQLFMKHKLKNKLEFFDGDLTEKENMIENGYSRIWDCGNAIFEI